MSTTLAGCRVALQREARRAAMARGHRLYGTWMGDSQHGANRCQACGAAVYVDAGTGGTSGSALTLRCTTIARDPRHLRNWDRAGATYTYGAYRLAQQPYGLRGGLAWILRGPTCGGGYVYRTAREATRHVALTLGWATKISHI